MRARRAMNMTCTSHMTRSDVATRDSESPRRRRDCHRSWHGRDVSSAPPAFRDRLNMFHDLQNV